MHKIRVMPAIGFVLLAVFILTALFGPAMMIHGPAELVGGAFDPPGTTVLGTDFLGRDLLSRLVYGARMTVFIAVAATTLGFVAGVAFGFIASERGGWVENLIDGSVNIMLSFPPLMLGLLVVAALSPSIPVLIVAIALIQMPRVARIVKSIGVVISGRQFVEVARARGENIFTILWRDMLPNSARPLSVEYGLRLTYTVLFISGLSFLGLGVQPPAADWGALVKENIDSMYLGAPLPMLAPALAIGLFAVAISFIVDWAGSRSSQVIPRELCRNG